MDSVLHEAPSTTVGREKKKLTLPEPYYLRSFASTARKPGRLGSMGGELVERVVRRA